MTPDDVPPSDLPTPRGQPATAISIDEATGDVLDPAPSWFQDGRVHSLEELDWAGGLLAEYERGIRENNALCDAAIARLQARRERLNAPFARQALAFRTAIEVYARENRGSLLVGLRKSRTLAGSGLTLKWRKVPAAVAVTDLEALALWAVAGDRGVSDAIFPERPPARFSDRLSKRGLNEFVAKTKIVPPGVAVAAGSETLSIEVDGEGK